MGYGLAIFPNNTPYKQFMEFYIQKDQIDKFTATPPIFARPVVVGCFSYFFGADHSAHDTGFMYLIRPKVPTSPFVLPEKDKTMGPEDYDLVPWGSSRIN